MKFPRTLCASVVILGIAPRMSAEVTVDGSFGFSGTLDGPNVTVPAEVGRTVGGNLFHSFSKFDIAAGEAVTFTGPQSVQHVLARVTGGTQSTINGGLRCDIPGADLYLINPAGVVFGPSAMLEVRGSFAVTSADYVRLGTDGRFDARSPGASVLVTSAPAAFGFSGATTPGPITVQASGLGVPNGNSISIAGGEVRIVGGQLLAGSGAVNFVAGPTGEATLTPSSMGTIVDIAPGDVLRNAVEISEGADIDVSGQTPGRVTIRGASFRVTGSGISSGASTGTSQSLPPVAFDVEVAGTLEVGPAGFLVTTSAGAGPAGDVRIVAGEVTIDRGDGQTFTGIGTQSMGAGRGGSIDIETQNLKIANAAGVFAFAGSGEPGGDVVIHADNVELSDGGQIVAQARGAAAGGNVTLDVDGLVTLHGSRAAIVSDTTAGSSGAGGTITLEATDLDITDTAFISATTNGAGAGGAINVDVANEVFLDGFGKMDFTGIGANTQPGQGAAGEGGSVVINAKSLTIREGAGVATKTFGGQNGGKIRIALTDELLIDARQSGQQTGLNAEATGAAANGGSITVRANSIELRNGEITASAVADGGTIDIEAPLTVQLTDSEILAEAGGNGGNVSIDPISVILNRSRISANAIAGNGGNILIRSQAFLASSDPETVVSASSEFGLVGNIDINAPDTEIAGSLVKLSSSLADTGATLPALCHMDASDNVSSFVATGRGGAPLAPDGWSASLDIISRD